MADHLPPRDRRRRKRLLTLRNAAWVIGIVLVAFGAYSLWNELNPKSEDGLALVEERKQKLENDIVREATPYVTSNVNVSEHDPREPISAAPTRNEEILGVEETPIRPATERAESPAIEPLGRDVTTAPATSFRGSDVPFAAQRSTAAKSRVRISGSGNSLTLETSNDGR